MNTSTACCVLPPAFENSNVISLLPVSYLRITIRSDDWSGLTPYHWSGHRSHARSRLSPHVEFGSLRKDAKVECASTPCIGRQTEPAPLLITIIMLVGVPYMNFMCTIIEGSLDQLHALACGKAEG